MKKILFFIPFIVVFILGLTGCSKELSDEKELKKWVMSEIGHVEEFMSYEETGTRNILVVKDKLGFTYEVASSYQHLSADGSTFAKWTETGDTYLSAYRDWLFKQLDLSKYPNLIIEYEHDFKFRVIDTTSNSESITKECYKMCESFIKDLEDLSKNYYEVNSVRLHILNAEKRTLGDMEGYFTSNGEFKSDFKSFETQYITHMTDLMDLPLGEITFLYSEEINYNDCKEHIKKLLKSASSTGLEKVKTGEKSLEAYIYKDEYYDFEFIILNQTDAFGGNGYFITDYYYVLFDYFKDEIHELKDKYNLSDISVLDASVNSFGIKVIGAVDKSAEKAIETKIIKLFSDKNDVFNNIYVVFE